MKLENQVCSFELAKRLKELGVEQESFFYWVIAYQNTNTRAAVPHIQWHCESMEHHHVHDDWYLTSWSAFTIAELGEILPPNVNTWGLCFDATSILTQDGIKNLWHGTYADYDKKMFDEVSDINLANCFAKLLIYLIENDLMKNDTTP